MPIAARFGSGFQGISFRLVTAVLLLASAAMLASAAIAQPSPAASSGSIDTGKIDALAHDILQQHGIPGMTLAIVDRGQMIYSSAYGVADLENKVPATPASEIRTASIAKPMTAIAVMHLVEQGKLNLDAPVQQYCPVFPAKSSFSPAGMTATLVDDPQRIILHRANGYEKTKAGELENAPFLDPSDRLPGGGWLSTSEDLARFASAVMSDKLVTSATLEEMWKPLTTHDDGSGYGLGWEIRPVDGHRVVGHNGGQAGTSTSLKLIPDRQLAVAVMTNLEGAKLDEFVEAILKLCLSDASQSTKP